jgi:class 3 adenylate cyclase
VIELGRLRIESEASIVDARNKIRGLAGNVGFDPVLTTRMAITVSEMCRKAVGQRGNFDLEIALDQRENRDGLALIFKECGGIDLNSLAASCFDRTQAIHATDTSVHQYVFRWIQDPSYAQSEGFIEQERDRISQLSKADQLLQVILPRSIAEELTAREVVENRRHENVAVLFADIIGFTEFCENRQPDDVVNHLQDLSLAFEAVVARYEVEKIKTIGDCFMAAAGLTIPLQNPVLNSVQCGLEMLNAAKELDSGWQLRIGIHVGAVIAGIVGHQRFSYDLWGDTVNTAARIESNGRHGSVNLSPQAWRAVEDSFEAESIGLVPIKGKGEIEIYCITD